MSDDPPLTPEQEALLEDIEEDEPSDRAIEALELAIDRFDYTATLLSALASYLRDEGDPSGADLLLEFSSEMAEHEARLQA